MGHALDQTLQDVLTRWKRMQGFEALWLPESDHTDAHLRTVVTALAPAWVIGVGNFAEARARTALQGMPLRIGKILHPSPANPAANRGWAEAASAQLVAQGVWPQPGVA